MVVSHLPIRLTVMTTSSGEFCLSLARSRRMLDVAMPRRLPLARAPTLDDVLEMVFIVKVKVGEVLFEVSLTGS